MRLRRPFVVCGYGTLMLLAIRSAKKINSHRWALQAFAPQLDPRVVVLIDVGTKPAAGSLYSLWKQFDVSLFAFIISRRPKPDRRRSLHR